MKVNRLIRAALVLGAVLAISLAGSATATSQGKVFVCKYVGTPGADERLQTGQNPISVSVNAIPDGASVGAYFADAQGRSFVLAFDIGQPEPDVSECPVQEVTPSSPPSASPSISPEPSVAPSTEPSVAPSPTATPTAPPASPAPSASSPTPTSSPSSPSETPEPVQRPMPTPPPTDTTSTATASAQGLSDLQIGLILVATFFLALAYVGHRVRSGQPTHTRRR